MKTAVITVAGNSKEITIEGTLLTQSQDGALLIIKDGDSIVCSVLLNQLICVVYKK